MKGKKVLIKITKEGCYKNVGETDYVTLREAEAWAGPMNICEIIDSDVEIIETKVSWSDKPLITIKVKELE